MARIAYDSHDEAAFEATRHLPAPGTGQWREAVAKHLNPQPGTRLLDLGAGTGMWAQAFTNWYDNVDVIAVEPSAAMRARCHYSPVLPGDASNLPLRTTASTGPGCHHDPPRARSACSQRSAGEVTDLRGGQFRVGVEVEPFQGGGFVEVRVA